MVASISSVAELTDAVRAGPRVEFLFFWGHQPQRDGSIGAGCLSQWWPASFSLDGQEFPTAVTGVFVAVPAPAAPAMSAMVLPVGPPASSDPRLSGWSTRSREKPMPEPEPAHDEHEADAEATEATDAAEADEPAAPANRAARRAKGKVASPQPHGKGQHFGGRGSVQSPRQWGNRRSG